MRFELTTPTLARLCSTPELRPLEQFSRRSRDGPCYCAKRQALQQKQPARRKWLFAAGGAVFHATHRAAAAYGGWHGGKH